MDEKKLDKQIAYTIACISEFAKHYQLSDKEAFCFLEKYGAIAFLKDCYEAEHTLSFDDAVDDMTRICLNHGGDIHAIVSRNKH